MKGGTDVNDRFQYSRSRGIAIISVMFALLILGMIAFAVIEKARTGLITAVGHRETIKSFQLAKGAVDEGFQWLDNRDGEFPCGHDVSWSHDIHDRVGDISVLISPDPANDCSDSASGWRYTITGSGHTIAGTTSRIAMDALANRNSFAGYAVWWQEDAVSWFGDFDFIDGLVFSNGANIYLHDGFAHPKNGCMFGRRVFIAGEGQFMCRGDGIPGDVESYATFNGGYEVGVEPIAWPPDVSAAIEAAWPTNGGMEFEGSTAIEMLSDGTLMIRNFRFYGDHLPHVNPLPPSGVIHIKDWHLGPAHGYGDLEIHGTLRGRLTILADRDIRIMDDIIYAHDPRFGPSDDMLGLIAGVISHEGGGVSVVNRIPGSSDGDFMIFAFLMSLGSCALQGECAALDVEELFHGREYEESLLIVYGGQASTSPSSTILLDDNGYPTNGFGVDAVYDVRGSTAPPPYYPYVDGAGFRWNVVRVDSTWHEIY